jgi:multicomponent Na+:H+ antiporter subunit A
VAKSALFMTAGAVTEATGEDRLSRLGGLGRRMPLLAASAGLAAANLAGLPLTVGFFKDELFFDAAHGAGPWTTVLAVLAAGLTLGYIGRFWKLLFLGRLRTAPHPVPALLTAPVAVLAVVSVVAGLVPRAFTGLAEAAGSVTQGAPVTLSPGYHLAASAPNLMALCAWVLGGLLVALPRVPDRGSAVLVQAGNRLGPLRIYTRSLRLLFRVSGAVHDREVRDLRTSIAAVLVPAGVLTVLAFLVTPTVGQFTVGTVRGLGWLVVPLLALVAVASVAAAGSGARLGMVLALSVVGFALSGVYGLLGAPDIALVSVLVETTITLVFLAALARLPHVGPGEDRFLPRPPAPDRRGRRLAAGILAGLAAFATVWGFLSAPTKGPSIAEDFIRLTPSAHGKDVVTVIITDFRGLDTLAEITVLLIAGVAVATLLRKGRLW